MFSSSEWAEMWAAESQWCRQPQSQRSSALRRRGRAEGLCEQCFACCYFRSTRKRRARLGRPWHSGQSTNNTQRHRHATTNRFDQGRMAFVTHARAKQPIHPSMHACRRHSISASLHVLGYGSLPDCLPACLPVVGCHQLKATRSQVRAPSATTRGSQSRRSSTWRW